MLCDLALAVLGQGRGRVELYEWPLLYGVVCLVVGAHVLMSGFGEQPWRVRVGLACAFFTLGAGLLLWYSYPAVGTAMASVSATAIALWMILTRLRARKRRRK